MNLEEVCLRLIEFYYTNTTIFKNRRMSAIDLANKYNKVLKVLQNKE